MKHMGLRVGVDTGGTFTDLVVIDEEQGTLRISKVSSTPTSPMIALQAVLEQSEADLAQVEQSIVGTTVATNAILERKGATVLFITTQGIEDILFIQRINRPRNYDLKWQKPTPLVKRRHCFGVRERMNYKGEVIQPLTEEAMEQTGDRIAEIMQHEEIHALGIALLFAYINPEHELQLSEYLLDRFPNLPQSVSHKIVPIWREYERSSTTVADAFVKPLITAYTANAEQAFQDLCVSGTQWLMKSNGGMTALDAAGDRPIDTLLSGPVAGVISANFFGQITGHENILTMDMGGTSCEVGLIADGEPRYTTGFEIEWGLPVAVPVVDVSTIGAGGGSIAWVDRGGFLRVGPESAGADPGPAAYGSGGTAPTVTDANLLLGRINPEFFLGGRLPLYPEKAKRVIANVADALDMSIQDSAAAIIKVVNDNMANAIRLLTVEKGIDPRDFTLVAFGGCGPLHASNIARTLQIPRVIIPVYPGLGSAFGTLIADMRVDKVWTKAYRSDTLDLEQVRTNLYALISEAKEELHRQGFSEEPNLLLRISMRYLGQNYEEDIPISSPALSQNDLEVAYEHFHERHRQFYGYAFASETIELVHFKVSAVGRVQTPKLPRLNGSTANVPSSKSRSVVLASGDIRKCPIYRRDELPAGFTAEGPAIIEEVDSTILIEADDTFSVDEFGVILITVGDPSQ